jgi:hypothetical protein
MKIAFKRNLNLVPFSVRIHREFSIYTQIFLLKGFFGLPAFAVEAFEVFGGNFSNLLLFFWKTFHVRLCLIENYNFD